MILDTNALKAQGTPMPANDAWIAALALQHRLPVLSRGLLYVVQNTRDTLRGTPPRLLCYDLRA